MKKIGYFHLEYVWVILAIICATGLFVPLRSYFAIGQWALLYLLIVVVVGSLSGFLPALLASVLAFFSWNYFLIPPYHTFAVADPKDLLSLFVFLGVGIIVGFQTAKLRQLGQIKAAHDADILKSTLISSVSHELKTPLASVTATISNLLSKGISWDEDYFRSELETVNDDLNRLNSGINSLLDFSRLETESWTPRKDIFELNEIIGSLADRLSNQQRNRLVVDIPGDLNALWIDFEQFLRLLQLLVENALNYSGLNSKVTIRAKENRSNILIMIEDVGLGIPDEEKTKVFEKFYRGQARLKTSFGTGLGLAIAAEIVKYHNGKIWIEDVLPHGTRMVISIPKQEIK